MPKSCPDRPSALSLTSSQRAAKCQAACGWPAPWCAARRPDAGRPGGPQGGPGDAGGVRDRGVGRNREDVGWRSGTGRDGALADTLHRRPYSGEITAPDLATSGHPDWLRLTARVEAGGLDETIGLFLEGVCGRRHRCRRWRLGRDQRGGAGQLRHRRGARGAVSSGDRGGPPHPASAGGRGTTDPAGAPVASSQPCRCP